MSVMHSKGALQSVQPCLCVAARERDSHRSHIFMRFDPHRDAANVTLDCRHLHCADHSAIAALEALHARYAKLGKRLRLTNLSLRNRRLLQRADAGVVMRQEGN
jgi:SulP family sulfate permease